MKLFQNPILLFCICLAASCKQEYYPKVKSSEKSVLVVEGALNTGDGPTTVRLTRTFKLDDTAQVQAESGAQLTVEDANGIIAALYDYGNGQYTTGQLNLNAAEKYRLHIQTADGQEYASDFVPVLQNPPIDSISWRQNEAGVHIFVNTHNPENNTRYYRWDFEETWQLHSPIFTYLKMVDNKPVQRQLPEEQVSDCWRFNNSSTVILSTTAQLSSDVVFERPLIDIPDASEKLSLRYSVLVHQYALDKQGYEFYQLMRKNTETLGSIFDAQPTDLTGNVHALSNTTDKVIGYITAAPVRETRIFITNNDVPNWKFRLDCSEMKDVPNNRDSFLAYFNGQWLPVYENFSPGGDLTGYGSVRPKCTDCTARGGSTEKPSYW